MTDGQDMQRGGLSLTTMSVEDLAKLVSKASSKPLTVETLNRHIANGAPVNEDGTINIIHYTAWLTREVATIGD